MNTTRAIGQKVCFIKTEMPNAMPAITKSTLEGIPLEDIGKVSEKAVAIQRNPAASTWIIVAT